MKRSLVACAVLASLAGLTAAAASQVRRPDPSTMTAYVVGVYTKGPHWTAERTPRGDSIQAAHQANMMRMAEVGALIGAGPVPGDHEIRGLLFFRDLPLDSVRAMVVKDPALQDRRLRIELRRWYAPRGIGEAYAVRASLRPDQPDSMIMIPMAVLKTPIDGVPPDSVSAARASAGHMAHTLDLLVSGKLLAAGPMFGDGDLRGLNFFGTDSATARRLSNEDPGVLSGRLSFELLPFWTAWGVLPPSPVVRELRR